MGRFMISDHMKKPTSLQLKLMAATLALLLVFGFAMFYKWATLSSGEMAFRVGCTLFAALLAWGGIFGNAQLQLLWGWGLAVTAALLLGLCLGTLRGPLLLGGGLATLTAVLGAYLLLRDPEVRAYRERLRQRQSNSE
jgi:hypothetical protein